MAVKLYVIPGHGDGDPGAGGTLGGVRYDEAERVRALASRIAELGGDAVATSDFSRNCYKDGGMLAWDFPAGCQVVELHMDSSGVGARGAHVIVDDSLEPDAYDEALAAGLAAMFPGRDERIAHRSDLKNVNQAAARGLPYRLVENGFIDSPEDLRTFNERIDDVAALYLEVFGIEGADVDADIRYMQGLARPMCERAGIEPPAATGQWNPDTQRALVHLAQTELMATCDPTLTPSGEIGGQSRAVMDLRPVREGDAGLAAWAVKAALVGHGYKGADVDGQWSGMDLTSWGFDAVADAALKRFQADNPPLAQTGRADASTWCTLCPNMYSDNPNR